MDVDVNEAVGLLGAAVALGEPVPALPGSRPFTVVVADPDEGTCHVLGLFASVSAAEHAAALNVLREMLMDDWGPWHEPTDDDDWTPVDPTEDEAAHHLELLGPRGLVEFYNKHSCWRVLVVTRPVTRLMVPAGDVEHLASARWWHGGPGDGWCAVEQAVEGDGHG